MLIQLPHNLSVLIEKKRYYSFDTRQLTLYYSPKFETTLFLVLTSMNIKLNFY